MLLQRWEAKIRRKESLPQPGIELTTTRSWVRHAHHWANRVWEPTISAVQQTSFSISFVLSLNQITANSLLQYHNLLIQIKSICKQQFKCNSKTKTWLWKYRKHWRKWGRRWSQTFLLLFPRWLKASWSESLKPRFLRYRFISRPVGTGEGGWGS